MNEMPSSIPMTGPAEIRLALRTDADAPRALQRLSLCTLGSACYDDDVIANFISHIGTMDERLIEDGTFFAAFVGGALVGCGGWTSRAPSYAPT
jgi:hypothetical protein